jgi:uncharacterized membrane protein YpjA
MAKIAKYSYFPHFSYTAINALMQLQYYTLGLNAFSVLVVWAKMNELFRFQKVSQAVPLLN